MRRAILLVALVVLSIPVQTFGQTTASGLISTEIARHFGLERMWFTQMAVDRGRGSVAGAFLHVSPTQAHTEFAFVHDGKRYIFSERDRDAFGKEIGVEGAKKKAAEQLEAIKNELAIAGVKDPKLPEIEEHVIPKITLYGTADRGTVHSIDAETGRTHWTANLGNPNYPTTAPGANDNYVGVINGSTLYVLKADDGARIWTRQTIGSPGAGPALTEEMIFVPMYTGQMEAFLLEDPKRPLATYQSFGRITVQPVVSANSVAWPTELGNLYVGLANEPGMRFRMQAKERIASAPAFLPPDKILLTSLDGYIYCISEAKGNILWRFTTGEPITHSPITLNETVYAITDRGNMYAINADDSQEQWIASGIRSYVAGNDQRLYCIDVRGNLTILDVATGRRVGTILTAGQKVPLMNIKTDRVIVISPTGLVQCFRENRLHFPQLHNFIEPAPAQPTRTPPSRGPAADAPAAEPPAAADPFAAGGADPFAAPGAEPAEPAAPAEPAVADPFATP